MGLIRGGLFVIVSVMFFLFLLVGNAALTLDMSLGYENVKLELGSVVESLAENQMNLTEVVDEDFEVMELYCQNNSANSFEYIFNEQGFTFVIPCEVVFQGSGDVIDYGINSLIDEAYYQKYDCNFWDCMGNGKSPFFFVSKQAKDYWHGKFYFALITLIVLLVSMFFLIEDKINLPIIIGSLLVVSSLPFMKLEWIAGIFSNEFFSSFFSIFFSSAYTVFLIVISLGVAVLIVGTLLKFFNIGFKISNLFKKDEKSKTVSKKEVKQIVQEEVSKGKNKPLEKK
ncbi:MAG TPA: hypothetical protein ENG87_01320 [Candidatus Pacearchaeota archaeon]|nr:hypothetical protein BMS3Abin17_00927 [archaeon BMS3Abin17]HDK41990.1 hypothetical protein [Candidatus Pacearchaeota archaeon]HDZ60492.1 hypothetical protein [Candidatus Pacearchaeota archaeon]